MYRGDFDAGVTLDFKFTTVKSTGVPETLAGTPAVKVYKNNSTTESTSGITLTVDFDSIVGLNNVRIDLSSDGTFYAAGSNFQVVITAGTVDSISAVGYVVGEFSIRNRAALYPTVAARTLDVASTGEAGLDFDNIKDASGSHTLTNITVPTVTTAGLSTAATQAIWDKATSLLTTSGSIGKLLIDQLAAIKAKTDSLTFTTALKVDAKLNSASDFAQGCADKVWDTTTRTLTALGFGVTVDTNNDKTGYTLSTPGILAVWHQLLSAITTAGSIGKLIKDYLDAAVSSRLASSSYVDHSTNIAAIKTKTDQLNFTGTDVKATLDSETVTVATNNDKTGYALSSAGIDAILDDTPSAELASVPTTTSSLRQMIQFIFSYFRNKKTVTSTTETLLKEDASSTLGTATLSDNGTVFTKGEMS